MKPKFKVLLACIVALILACMVIFLPSRKLSLTPPEKIVLIKWEKPDSGVCGEANSIESVNKVMAWLEEVGNGPVEPHAVNGKCALDYVLELYNKKEDRKPSLEIYIHLDCNHVLGRKMSSEQFKSLRSLFERNSIQE